MANAPQEQRQSGHGPKIRQAIQKSRSKTNIRNRDTAKSRFIQPGAHTSRWNDETGKEQIGKQRIHRSPRYHGHYSQPLLAKEAVRNNETATPNASTATSVFRIRGYKTLADSGRTRIKFRIGERDDKDFEG